MSEENYMTPLSLVIPQLRKKGYGNDFELTIEGMLSRHTKEVFQPEELTIERVYRFEGNSNPDDMAVMYGVASAGGTKGIIIDAYGTYYDDKLGDFLRKVKIQEVQE
ncbi:MAG: phosphoribosylpyrophosphate synthetase [bacterium]|nr:phosphoribosylpyrophosphate synthetase [bacterium]